MAHTTPAKAKHATTPLKAGVVIRRARRRSVAGPSGPGAYRPAVIGRRPFVATAVEAGPTVLNEYESDDFGYAAYTTIVPRSQPEPTGTPDVEATPEPVVVEAEAVIESAKVDVAEVAAEASAVEPAAAPDEVAADEEPGTPETPAAVEVDEATGEPAAAEASDSGATDDGAANEAPPEQPESCAAEEGEEEEDYSSKRRVSADDAERIAEELLTAAQAREQSAEVPPAEESEDKKPTGPRVLGRIDLKRKVTPVRPAEQPKPAAPETETDGKGRKRKRKVVKKDELFDAMERAFRPRPRKKRAAPGQKVHKTEVTTPRASKRVVKVNDMVTPGELAKSMGVKAGEVVSVLMRLGVMKSINDMLDLDTATLVADEFGYTVENTAVDVDRLLEDTGAGEAEAEATPRRPVVTVMGHVDHGKTSLLDSIRKANVVASESGGITQHIGAYLVETERGSVCFLDTPGHAAFTAMRARGAKVTDIVVLVVAADDGVMPQTIEAVNHAKAAELPVVVAVNKMDKVDANPDRIKQQLSEYGLQPEEWGGDTQFVPVSALKGDGIDELLEAVVLQAEFLELTAPAAGKARGTVVEARLDKGRGPVATLLVQEGTLRAGDNFVCGETTGRVRAMTDHTGAAVKEAGPATPVELIGLDGVPAAGDTFVVVEDMARAQQVAEHRRDLSRKQELAATTRMSLEDLQRQVAAGETSELKIIIKADVDGSVEAIRHALENLSNDEVTLRVIHGAVGAVTESDVQLAMASEAIIAGFHVRPEAKARQLAERENVDIRLHSVIYELIDEVKLALEGLLAPEYREVVDGRIEVRDTFSTPAGTIAGSYVLEGNVKRGQDVRVLRDNVVLSTTKIGSLRRFKDDVREVKEGYECGIGLERYNDVKVGDIYEVFHLEAIKRTLESASGGSGSSGN